jgi:DNA-binding LacI/PurR family transcriptional regulator
VASGALQALREHGRRVPDDVAPVGFDDLASIAGTTDPPLTTIHQDVEEMGRRTVRPLFDRTRQVRSEVVPTRPVRRRSA